MIGLVSGMFPVLLLPRLPQPWLTLLLSALGLLLLLRRGFAWRFCAGLAVGCALALSCGQAMLDRRLAETCVGQPLSVTGEVASLPRLTVFPERGSRQRFEFAVRQLEPPHCRGPDRVLLSYYGPAKMIPGDRWTFPVRLRKPWGLANPGSFNQQSWYAQTGIDAVGSVSAGKGVRATPRRARWTSLTLPADRQRQLIAERISALPLGTDVTAILAALTVADKSGIDTRLWTLFQHFGLNHLLVISGLHIGLVAAAAFVFGNLLQRTLLMAGLALNWLPAVLALLCSTAYCALAGFSVATQRALCMLLCFILAALAGRGSAAANNLLLAAAVVLLINPLVALGSGFWLSFASVAALLWLAQWQPGRRPWRRALWTHGYMSLVMLPLGAWWFGGSSLVAGLANFALVPLVGLVVVPLALLAVVAMYLLPGMELFLWRMAAWPLQQLLPLAQGGVDHADSWLYRNWQAGLTEVVLAVTGVVLLVLPLQWRGRALAVLLVLPMALPPDLRAAFPAVAEPAGLTRVTVLDVGQGTSVVVQSGDRTLVYDTGGGDPAGANMASTVLLPYLRLRGAGELDTLVISHPDNDHSAGAATLLAALPAGRVYYGGRVPGLTRGRPCRAGQAWRWPRGQTFRFLSPAGADGGSSNDSSCVLQIEAAGHRLLLAGDIENARERELVRYWGDALASDWLLVAHHGSRTSSSWAVLKFVQPAMAAVSSGYANRFGHPHPAVVERLRRNGALVYDTAAGGALEFEFAPGEPIRVRAWRQRQRRFWR